MAIAFQDFQKFGAPIGASPVSHLLQAYSDGSPIVAARLTNNHASLTGRLTISVVAGQVQLVVDTSGMTDGTYWYVAGASTDGVSWTDQGSGGEIEVYTEDVETITVGAGATHTMTANLPSAGKTKLVINFGSSTSVLDGSASRFVIDATTTPTNGGVVITGPGTCYRIGSSTVPAISSLQA